MQNRFILACILCFSIQPLHGMWKRSKKKSSNIVTEYHNVDHKNIAVLLVKQMPKKSSIAIVQEDQTQQEPISSYHLNDRCCIFVNVPKKNSQKELLQQSYKKSIDTVINQYKSTSAISFSLLGLPHGWTPEASAECFCNALHQTINFENIKKIYLISGRHHENIKKICDAQFSEQYHAQQPLAHPQLNFLKNFCTQHRTLIIGTGCLSSLGICAGLYYYFHNKF